MLTRKEPQNETVVLNISLCNEPIPSASQRRAEPNPAAQAVAAWEQGRRGAALLWAGWYWPELEVGPDAVWVVTYHAPTGGNSPKAIKHRSKLATSTVGAALQEAILADYKAGKL